MRAIWYIIVSMRPRQWTKNLVLFAGVVFSRHLFDPAFVSRSLWAFVIFCGLSGALYILNDLVDRRRDTEHPGKRKRPIAAGLVPARTALAFSAALIAALLAASALLGGEFLAVSAAFAAVNILYSLVLRSVVILDVISIAFSFLLRAAAGVSVLHPVAPEVALSPWLLICTLFLSLFLGFSKRRYELRCLEAAESHRHSLRDYSVVLLDQLVVLSATSALVAYSIYTVWPTTIEKFGTAHLVYTIPFVVFGIMRYLYIVYSRNEGGDPSGVVLMERWILADVLLWILSVVFIIWRA